MVFKVSWQIQRKIVRQTSGRENQMKKETLGRNQKRTKEVSYGIRKK